MLLLHTWAYSLIYIFIIVLMYENGFELSLCSNDWMADEISLYYTCSFCSSQQRVNIDNRMIIIFSSRIFLAQKKKTNRDIFNKSDKRTENARIAFGTVRDNSQMWTCRWKNGKRIRWWRSRLCDAIIVITVSFPVL